MPGATRKIIHVDMDAFFASIEQRDHPEYRAKPLAVGYSGNRGVVAAASYEARRFGVHSAMSSRLALRRCPGLIFLPPRFEHYRAVSRQIRAIFEEYTDLIEPLSLDEAFLDVSKNHKNMASATRIAQEIKASIRSQTGLTASAGVSFNKFLSKIASDYNKPDGLFVIKPSDAEAFVEKLPIEKFFGVGRVTAERMHRMGIRNGLDLKHLTKAELVASFGKMGHAFYGYARAIDPRVVEAQHLRRSLGTETTFSENLTDNKDLLLCLQELTEELMRRIGKSEFKGRSLSLKIKYEDFKIVSRSYTASGYITDSQTLFKIGRKLLQEAEVSKPVRLMGLSLKTAASDRSLWKSNLQLSIPFETFSVESQHS